MIFNVGDVISLTLWLGKKVIVIDPTGPRREYNSVLSDSTCVRLEGHDYGLQYAPNNCHSFSPKQLKDYDAKLEYPEIQYDPDQNGDMDDDI